jgi:protein-S-isoprenylcysteine O-methyltransferase Ste14
MENKITRWGIGPKFAVISVVYSIIILILHSIYFQNLTFVVISKTLNLVLGIILIMIGIPIFLIPELTVVKYFQKGELCKEGVYSFMRHPIYGAWIVFMVPGIVLIFGSILGITIPIFMYCILRIFIVDEERYLERKFGKEYLEYKKKVGALFPKLWRLLN